MEGEVPFVSIDAGGTTRSSVSSSELSRKVASRRFRDHGLLLGGGIGSELPTGSDAKGIGSGHRLGLSAFVDAGWKRGKLELVSFVETSGETRLRDAETGERALAFSASALYHAGSFVDLIAE